ncbi:MAG: hypothetical protein NTU53_01925 [Planctomycetota bacterium]|nr:hypothetical protein [Planctomycetota bacterium]
MRLKSATEAATTRSKLARLEAQYAAALHRHPTDSTADQAILYSLRRMINQLKEELILYDRDLRTGRLPAEPLAPQPTP